MAVLSHPTGEVVLIQGFAGRDNSPDSALSQARTKLPINCTALKAEAASSKLAVVAHKHKCVCLPVPICGHACAIQKTLLVCQSLILTRKYGANRKSSFS